MEIEIDGKALLRWLAAIAIVVGLLFALSSGGGSTALRLVQGLLHRGQRVVTPHNVSPDGRSTPAPAQSAAEKAAPEPGPTPVIYSVPGRPTLVFEDLSARWDWTVNEQCLPKLLDWLRGDKWIKGHDFEKLTIGLVDEKAPEKLRLGPKGQEYDLIYGAALPVKPPNGKYEYGSLSACKVDDDKGEITCYVAPKMWETDYGALSATVVASWISAMEEELRPKTKEAWTEYSGSWSITNYIPLIRQEGERWRSDCLEVKPQG